MPSPGKQMDEQLREHAKQTRVEYEDAVRQAEKAFRQLRNQGKISNRLIDEHPNDYELQEAQEAKLNQLATEYFTKQAELLKKIEIYKEENEKLPPQDRQDLSAIYESSKAREEQYNQDFDYLDPIPANASLSQEAQDFEDLDPNEDDAETVYNSENEFYDEQGEVNAMTDEEMQAVMEAFDLERQEEAEKQQDQKTSPEQEQDTTSKQQEEPQKDSEEQEQPVEEVPQGNEATPPTQADDKEETKKDETTPPTQTDEEKRSDGPELTPYENMPENYRNLIQNTYEEYLNGAPQSLEAVGKTLSNDDLKKVLYEITGPDQGVINQEASTKEEMMKELSDISAHAVDLGQYGSSTVAHAVATVYAYKNIDAVMKQMEEAGVKCTTKELETIGQEENTSSIFTSQETLHDIASKYPNVIEEVTPERQISPAEQDHRNFQQTVMETLRNLGETGCRKKAMELIQANDKLNHVERSEADYNRIIQSQLLGSNIKREYSESRSTYTPGAILNWTDAGNKEHRVNYVTLAKIAVEKELLEKIAAERGISPDSKELSSYTTFQTGEMNAMVNRTVDMADAYKIAQIRENMREMIRNDPRSVISGLGEKEIYDQWKEEVKYMPSTKIRGQLETYSEARDRMTTLERDKAREIDDLMNEPQKLDPMLADRLATLYQEQYPDKQPNMENIQKIIEEQQFTSYNERLDFAENMNKHPEKYLEQIHSLEEKEQEQDQSENYARPENEYEGVGKYNEPVRTEKTTQTSFESFLKEMKDSALAAQTKTEKRTETIKTVDIFER